MKKALVCGLLLVAGCSDLSGLSLIDLASHRELWQSLNLHSYTVQQTHSCFCQYSGQAVAVRVDADTVTSVTLIASGEAINKQGWQTIPEIFDYARRLLDAANYKVRIRYDESSGVPTFISYECPANLADCGSTMTISLVESR